MEISLEQELVLIHRAQSGDEQAFQQLLDLNFIKSKAIIQKQFKLSYHDLQDLMQSTSLLVWKNFKDFRTETSFFSWFYTIFKNETLAFLNKRNIIEKHELSDVIIDAERGEDRDTHKVYVNSLDAILDDTARTFLEKKEDILQYKLAIIEMLASLKSHHRDIINMIMIEGKSYKEVADILNIPLGSVMSRLHYAKIEAQKIINEYSRTNDIELALLG